VGLACLAPLATDAQSVSERRLQSANAKLSKDFSSIGSVRELSDGRVLVADPKDATIFVVDFRLDRALAVGRKGNGPGEYSRVGGLTPLSGDSTMMIVPLSRRGLVLYRDSIVETLSTNTELVARANHGASNAGNVLQVRQNASPRVPVVITGAQDSSSLVLIDRRTGSADTIGRTRVAETHTLRTESNGNVRTMIKAGSPLAAAEPVALFLDGWLVVVRRDPYRVDWRNPNGTWVVGPNLPFTRTRVDAAEKRAALRKLAQDSPNPGARELPADFFTEWPEYYPPFPVGRSSPVLHEMPDGNVAIQRSATARSPETRYDIVDRQGRLIGRVVLAPGERIAGYGAKSLYVVSVDEDGLHWLSRHAWSADQLRR
jgi:hypothetical protein